MGSVHRSKFSRRSEWNGTIVSTCNACSTTVAASVREVELDNAEREHICDPQTLDHWKSFIDEVKRRNRKTGGEA